MEIDLNSINCIMFNVENLETPELEIFFFVFILQPTVATTVIIIDQRLIYLPCGGPDLRFDAGTTANEPACGAYAIDVTGVLVII